MIVDRVQAQLEAIYGIRCPQRASQFLVGPDEALELGATGRAEEELLVSEEADGLSVALYFSPQLLERLSRFENGPAAGLMEGLLGSYCELAEGVSHFLYVVRAAEQERAVSLLEMEAQAEVDKFASCVLGRWREGVDWARALFVRLFEQISLRPGLEPAERWRYSEANRLAKAYCGRLLKHVTERRRDRLLAELRHSYRMGSFAKLKYLARAA